MDAREGLRFEFDPDLVLSKLMETAELRFGFRHCYGANGLVSSDNHRASILCVAWFVVLIWFGGCDGYCMKICYGGSDLETNISLADDSHGLRVTVAGDLSVGSVPDVPHNASSHPAPSIQLETRHNPTATRVLDTPGPSRVGEFGLIAFIYKELRDATDNFSATNFLGEGGLPKVYKGALSSNRMVVVKLLKNENSKTEREFRNEVDIISHI